MSTAVRRIPLSRPYIGEREEELVLEVLRSGRLSMGPMIDRFEELFAERVGAPHAVSLTSATAGLHLLCHGLGLGAGDEVITSPISFVATANCFIVEGATPVFADVDPATLNLDPAAVEAAITPRTRAIVAVDMFGYPCELDEIRAIASRHGLAVISDSAEALGSEYKGRPVGSHGVPAVFGFYPNKQITTGEGGVVTTHSQDEAQLLRSLRNQGRSYESRWFHHVRVGLNYRFTDLQAAVGLAQLEKLDEILSLRAAAAARYTELLVGIDGLQLPHPDDGEHKRSWFVYVVRIPRAVDHAGVLDALASEGIEAGHYVPCVHLQPYMREQYGFGEGLCPVAEDAADRSVALPFFPAIEAGDQERVVEALRSVLAR
ncbi:MAG TPA: DegT/DnrJ/EryC1/StrS family aminotransferase [Gaiellaceae bacterium]|nr:DegT/DnrJ/EryC1/StrS family aminotransferase [Gaiellaceae bacterium]